MRLPIPSSHRKETTAYCWRVYIYHQLCNYRLNLNSRRPHTSDGSIWSNTDGRVHTTATRCHWGHSPKKIHEGKCSIGPGPNSSRAHTHTLTASSQCASSPGPSSPRKFNFANHGNHMMYDKQILMQLEGNLTFQIMKIIWPEHCSTVQCGAVQCSKWVMQCTVVYCTLRRIFSLQHGPAEGTGPS